MGWRGVFASLNKSLSTSMECILLHFGSRGDGEGEGDLERNLAHSLDSCSSQGVVDVRGVLRQLGGNLVCVGLIRNGAQDLQLDHLDVRRLVLAAVEAGVYLQHYCLRCLRG
jgi:hypothetical protein